jgi:hypothetical protein
VKDATHIRRAAWAGLSLVLMAGPVRADGGPNNRLRAKVAELAGRLTEVVKDEGQTTIAVGDFQGPAQFTSNHGPGLRQLLIEELEAIRKGTVRTDSMLSVKGDYEFVADGDRAAIELSLQIRTNNGKKVGQMSKRLMDEPVQIKDSEVIAVMTGRTMHLPPDAGKEYLHKEIQKHVKEPTYTATGTRIATTKDSPYAIELLVAGKGHIPADLAGWAKVPAREATAHDRQPFVGIKRDEAYAVRVWNHSKYEAAVTLCVDGLDAFTFSAPDHCKPDGRPKYSHFVVGPGQHAILPGWFRTPDVSDAFLVTEYAKAAVAGKPTAARGSVGVVTVTFAAAWEGDKKPADEIVTMSAGDATGKGPPIKTGMPEVRRTIGVVRDVISVRYTRPD